MGKVTSADGTKIAYERVGEGPAIVVVDGMFLYRAIDPWTPQFAGLLADRYSVYYYERRGRGESGDSDSYEMAREIEDLAAVIEAAGGEAYVVGMSSGGVLAVEATAAGLPVKKLAVYEPPLVVDDSRTPVPDDYLSEIRTIVAEGRKGDAIGFAGVKAVGFPEEAAAMMREQPFFPAMEAIGHTTAYDAEIMDGLMFGKPVPADRRDRWSKINVPTLVAFGGASEQWMHSGAKAVAEIIPNAKLQGLKDQTHEIAAEVLAATVTEHFTD
ncbi:alpha/beta fold hydrolase [Actinokineospora sp. NPDC004072]